MSEVQFILEGFPRHKSVHISVACVVELGVSRLLLTQ